MTAPIETSTEPTEPLDPSAAAAAGVSNEQPAEHTIAPQNEAPHTAGTQTAAAQAATVEGPSAQAATPEVAPSGEGTPSTRSSLENLKFAVVALIVLAAAVVAIGQLSGATTSEGSSDADAAALAVIASDIVTSAKNDGGAVDAIGGYLPGTGMVLTVELDDVAAASTADWVSDHLGPFAETLAIMPADESIVVTINDRARDSARVWSLPVAALGSSVRDWNQLVAPATFESNEAAIAVDVAPLDNPESVEAVESVDDEGPFAEVASSGDDEPVEEAAAEDTVEAPSNDAPVDEEPVEDNFGSVPLDEAAEEVADVPDGGDVVEGDPVVDGNGGDGIDLADGGEPQIVSAFEDGDNFSPIFGSWVLDDGVYSQSDATGFGYSAAYAGIVPDVYDVSVDMRAPNGDLNAGIIYGMPERNRKHGGKVIDLTAESTYLRWGEYAEDTGDWAFLGGAPIEPGLVQDEWQNLKLEVRPEGTTVLLNDEFITTLDPVETGGHVALVVSIAYVEFRDFFITAPGGEAIGEPTADADGGSVVITDGEGGDDYVVFDDELREWTLLSGNWTAEGDVLSQSNGQAYDQMVHFSNFEQDDYRVQVDLRAKPDSIFSGGLLFNVNTFGQRPESQLFDIVDDGQVVRWAGYDQNGVFSYVGGLRTAAGFDPDEWHTIAVEVREGRASFFVDGEQVGASDSVGDAGYVGLVTSLAAMEFRNFAITTLG